MKLEKAKEIASKIEQIEREEKQIQRFDNTVEFCKIEIRGEDGGERAYSFTLDHNKDQDIIDAVRIVVNQKLHERKVKILDDIESA